MKPYYKYIIPGVIVVAIAVLIVVRARSGDTSAGRRQNVPNVEVSVPTRQTMNSTLEFTGDMAPIQQATIYSKVSGNLEQVEVQLGAFVRRNQLLALIDTTELYQAYQQTRATYENNRELYRRNLTLSKNNLVSRQDVDNSNTAMKVAKGAFDNAATRLSYASIRAPFSGFITRRFVDPGANITSNNSTLFTLMDMDSMKIYVSILEKDIPLIVRGKKAVIHVDAYPTKTFDGVVSRLSEAVDLSTRTMAVQIDIPNREKLLKPGMFASVTLIVDQHENALVVPTEAILSDDQGPYLFAAEGDMANMIRMQRGFVQSDLTEVLSGVTDSTRIITTGQQFVRPDGPISIH
jgi:membrane fusion protein, multidrug efflux system